MLYQIIDGTVSVGGQTILSHIDFEVKGREKIGIVGLNGAGKTTLLRLIAGELVLDRDDKRMGPGIRCAEKVSVGYLRQTAAADADKTVEQLLWEGYESSLPGDMLPGDAGAWQDDPGRSAYEVEYDRLFTGLGFAKDQKKRRLSDFSGGEQTKISLIRLLLMKPDLLLLDEPTNHLDFHASEWLEKYMKDYSKAVVIVSHDRFFLDQVVDVIYELQGGKLKRYPGSYTQYRMQKQRDLAAQKKAYQRQQAELTRLNALIEKFKHKPNKAAFARSRKTVISRMEQIACPQEDDAHIFTGAIEPRQPGSKWVFEAEHLKLGYDQVLLELSLRVRRGQKIGIIGDNGVGKSTFLKTLAGYMEPLAGKCALGNHISLGYFDQQSADVRSDKAVFAHFHELFPSLTEKEVRRILASYLFRGRDAGKRVSSLSGGEKARLLLAELLTAGPNLLVLDEPTNHMDIPAKETLESAFRSYTGTIIFVSHDRYFIRQVADAILLFEDASVMYYPFGYEHYLERKNRQGNGKSPAAMVQAQEQAMLEGLWAVPRAERHRLKEIHTEEAYADWKLRLAAEPLAAAQEQVARLWQQWEDAQTEYLRRLWQEDPQQCADVNRQEDPQQCADVNRQEEDPQQCADVNRQEDPQQCADGNEWEWLQCREQELAAAWDAWTNQCLLWWDVYCEVS